MGLQADKERVSIVIDKKLKSELKKEAFRDNRSLSSYIANLLSKNRKK